MAACAPHAGAAADMKVVGAPGGGVVLVTLPTVKKVKCVAGCARRKGVQGGSTIKLGGENLGGVAKVTFKGSRGKADDVTTSVRVARARLVKLRVPEGAASGAIVAVTSTGVSSRASKFVQILPPPPVIGSPDLQPLKGLSLAAIGGGSVETGTSTPRVVFLGAKQLVRFSVRVTGIADATAAISLMRTSDGATVGNWRVAAPDGQVVSVEWDGLAGGAPQGNGRYAFRLALETPAGQLAASAGSADPNRDAFDLYGYIFPIRGKHQYGMSAGRFGNNRGSHRHQGQDTFARCGTRLVAARGGVVRVAKFQSAAGNYVVIDTDFSDVDMAYMHLRVPSPFRAGDRVYTGQQIGEVGQTGRASGCHLHFEEWSGPGWYRGGRPFDPLPDLLAWDAVS